MQLIGPSTWDIPISGNIDPTILFGTNEQIEQAVRYCIDKAGGPGKHLLNRVHQRKLLVGLWMSASVTKEIMHEDEAVRWDYRF